MRRAVALAALAAAALPAGTAGADSFNPISLTVSVAPVARLHRSLHITVSVSADPSVLDVATAPLRIRVKLAGECGGAFDGTSGAVLLDKRLSPRPATGHAYAGAVTGSGRPDAYGGQTVCVYLEEEGDSRQFATDGTTTVDVSQPCTAAAARYDRASKRLARARKHHRRVARARHAAAAARRRARRACGPGVPL